ncbi:MAG: hypothetical protein N2117_01910 [Anaerolineales bacterium]|nr:hypothetical protein [Anaerolineales bacterium]
MMTGLAYEIARIIVGFYLFFCYPFFLFPYLAYIREPHPASDKMKRTVVFLLTPMFLPFLLIWGILSVFGSVLLVFLFTWVSLLAWVYTRFPFGKVFKAWMRFGNRVFDRIQSLLPFFGLPRPVSDEKRAMEFRPLRQM